MSQQVDGGNASCGLGSAELSQYANFTTSTFSDTPGSTVTIGANWSWQVWTLGHTAFDSCSGTNVGGFAYVHAMLGVTVFDSHNPATPIGIYGEIVWSEGLYYNNTNYFPHPNGAAWNVNESASNTIISSSFTLGASTSGSYFVEANVWVFTAASLSFGDGDAWACADGYQSAS